MSKLKYEKGHSKVEGHSLLIREESSGAIINNDITGYQAAIRRKKVFYFIAYKWGNCNIGYRSCTSNFEWLPNLIIIIVFQIKNLVY